MSGILALASSVGTEQPASATIERMGARTRHRPAHVVDVAAPSNAVGLGLHRLRRQPASIGQTRNGKLWISMSGFFTAAPLGGGPTPATTSLLETAGDLYDREGADGFTRLAGGFALTVWDPEAGELVFVNDRFGLCPHYWALTPAGLAIAPEMKALLAVPGFQASIDPVALGEYVRFQQMLGDRTWFSEIKVVPPASLIRYTTGDGRLSMQSYWSWSRIRPHRARLRDAAQEVDGLLDRAVSRRLADVRRPALYLSGGLDSRMLLGYVPPSAAVTAFTYGAENSRDVVLARRIAQAASATHAVFPFRNGRWVLEHTASHIALTEGQHGWHHLHGMTTLDAAEQRSDVNLTGWGGGSLLAGHLLDNDLHGRRQPGAVEEDEAVLNRLYAAFCQRFTWPGLTDAEATRVLRRHAGVPLDGLAYQSLADSFAGTRGFAGDLRPDFFYTLQHDRRSTLNLVVFQRAAIEVRCPYFDYDLIDYVYGLPPVVRLDRRLRWLVMERRMPHLSRIPHDRDWRLPMTRSLRTVHHLGRAAIARLSPWLPVSPLPDTLYADYEEYLRTDLREWAEDLLLSPRACDRGLFDPDAVRGLWNRHLSGHELWTIGKVAPIMTIELVMRALVD
jgi:asparagine synthase (glutamine-hydrolysing)